MTIIVFTDNEYTVSTYDDDIAGSVDHLITIKHFVLLYFITGPMWGE